MLILLTGCGERIVLQPVLVPVEPSPFLLRDCDNPDFKGGSHEALAEYIRSLRSNIDLCYDDKLKALEDIKLQNQRKLSE